MPPKSIIKERISLDEIFLGVTLLASLVLLFIFFNLFYQLLYHSLSTLLKFGLKFFVETRWDPSKNIYSALPFIFGTFYTATLALIISFFLSLGTAIFLTELAPPNLRELFAAIVDLIAAIPSVVIGLWGIFYLAPFVRESIHPILSRLSFIPLFQGETTGLSYLTAILVLTFMISPIMTSFFKSALESVPDDLKDALYALGATRYEVIKNVSIPYTKTALLAGVILAYGRALGETMAVTMVIGNQPIITLSLFSPGYTLSSVIANEFLEATNRLYVSSLITLGLTLFIISFIVNLIGMLVIRRWSE